MSALSFKITTDTAKINNFRKSLERLYELLEKFPSKSSGFKVINRHISDLETRVDQAIRKIAKMQQQAAESAAKVATPATPTATPSNSKTTSGSQTAQAEAAAYKDLIGTIREASAQKKIYTAQIELLKTKTQALTAEYNALSKAEKNNAAVSQAQKDKRLDLSLSIAKNKEELALYQGTLKNIIKTEQFAEGSINKMSQSLTRMKNIYRNLSAAERRGHGDKPCLKISTHSIRRLKNWMRQWGYTPAMSVIMLPDSICLDSRFSKSPVNCRRWRMARRFSFRPYPTTCRCWPTRFHTRRNLLMN